MSTSRETPVSEVHDCKAPENARPYGQGWDGSGKHFPENVTSVWSCKRCGVMWKTKGWDGPEWTR